MRIPAILFMIVVLLPLDAGADMVVIASNAEELAPGTIVQAGEIVTLPDDTVATLINETGAYLTIRGPYRAVPVTSAIASDTGVLAAISALLGELDAKSITAAVRSAGVAGGLTGALSWIDASVSQHYCVITDHGLHLWRPEADSAEQLRIANEDGETDSLEWQSGEHIVAWPTSLPVGDMAAFDIIIDDPPDQSRVVFHHIDIDELLSPAAISALVKAGCKAQAMLLTREVRTRLALLDINVSTDRGRQPRYRIGETLRISVRVNRDAAIYCFYRSSDGMEHILFPHRGVEGDVVRAEAPLTIPGPLVPGVLKAAAPPGTEAVHCYASETGVRDQLPHDLFGPVLTPVAAPYQQYLADMLMRAGATITSTLTLTIIP